MDFINQENTVLHYEIPLAEMITDFYDQLKSQSRGFASVEYKIKEFRHADIQKVVFALNGEDVDALTFLVHESRVRPFAKRYAEKLKDLIPRQLFQIAIQAKVGKKVVAREDLKAY